MINEVFGKSSFQIVLARLLFVRQVCIVKNEFLAGGTFGVCYSISKISRIVGISTEAVRLYEKKGVVSPQRNSENGYRSFHTLDVGTLLRCRTYAQMGFSLDETAELINGTNVQDVHALLSRQADAMEHEMEWHRRTLNRVRDLNRQILACEKDAGTFRIEAHPGIFQLDYRHNDAILDDEARMALYPEWSAWVPLSFVSLRFPLDALERGETEYYGGIGIMAEDAHFLGVTVNEYVRCLPAHLAVRGVLRIPGERRIRPEDFSDAFSFIRSSGLKPCGDPFTRMIVTVNRYTENFMRYYEMWIPVDSKIQQK